MSQLRRQIVAALSDTLQNRLKLPAPPTEVSAPPSAVSEYPSCAIWLEKANSVWSHEDELEVDSAGELKSGSNNDLEQGVGAAIIQEGVHLSVIGTLRCTGRIWAGSRLPGKREELEDRISECFTQDPVGLGTLLIEVKKPKVGNFNLPWSWTGAVYTDQSEWSAEFAFAERLWDWLSFGLDVAILVPRFDPLIKQFKAVLNGETTTFTVPF
jgi:hypothetical protein